MPKVVAVACAYIVMTHDRESNGKRVETGFTCGFAGMLQRAGRSRQFSTSRRFRHAAGVSKDVNFLTPSCQSEVHAMPPTDITQLLCWDPGFVW